MSINSSEIFSLINDELCHLDECSTTEIYPMPLSL